MSTLKIAIVGAGPVGCALARILTQSTISSHLSITAFEGESSLNVRSQGGTLDLHRGSGLDAIFAANLQSEFERYARYDGESLLVCDKYLTPWVKMTGDASDKANAYAPEIDRFRLRQILLESLPEGSIQWGKRLADIRENEISKTGRYSLQFRDGTSANDFDLVVGADGAWSKVRPLLSTGTPLFTSVGAYSFTISRASVLSPETVALANGGSIFSQHDNVFLAIQRMGDDHLQVACYFLVDGADWAKKTAHDSTDLAAVRNYVLETKLADWDPKLRAAIEATSPETTQLQSYALNQLPVGFSWTHRQGVTLVGDAAHLMTPFAGEGVNQGLTDAKVLAEQIVKAVEASSSSSDAIVASAALDSAVRTYEAEMFPRMKAIMAKTEGMKQALFFSPGGLYENVGKFICAAAEDAVPGFLMPVMRLLVEGYFWWFKVWYKPQR